MERIHLKGNTHCLKGRHLLPYYQIDGEHCILLDAGHRQDREKLEQALQDLGLKPVGILLTHMHYDHHENTRYFREKYGIPVAMPRIEAEICRSTASLKNHLFCFPYGLIAQTTRLQNLICPVDRPIEQEEEQIFFAGVTFGIVHSPGHSPDHICIITPDDVCCVGDALLSGEDLKSAEIPFVFDMSLDFSTKETLRTLDCALYLVSHMGIYSALQELIDENLAVIQRQLASMRAMVTKPMTFCECYEGIRKALGHTEQSMHPVMNLHLERYMRPYLEYLVDSGQLILVCGKGAPTVAPVGYKA